MTTPVGFFVERLLLPLLAAAITAVLLVINQQKGLLSGRQIILLVVVYVVLMTMTGLFGLIDLWFMPLYYGLVSIIFMGVGLFYLRHLDQLLGQDRFDHPLFVHLATGLILVLGWYFFSLLFNYFGSLQYGFWAATALISFVIPLLFSQAYHALAAIPNEIRKVWYYPRQAPEIVLDGVDYYRMMIIEVELRKDPSRPELTVKVKARAMPDIRFGNWFQKFIDDYNHKFPNEPIQTLNAEEKPYGWSFYYVRPSLFGLRRYIDADRTVYQNRLKERHTIIAKRVEEL